MSSYLITTLMDNADSTITGTSGIDLFSYSQFFVNEVTFYLYITEKTDIGRMDRVAIKLWGDEKLLPELMLLNSWKNPYAINSGQILYVCSREDIDRAIKIPDINTKLQLVSNQNTPTRNRPSSLVNNNIVAAVPTKVSDSTNLWLNGEVVLPPNAPRTSKNNIEVIGGKVVFR